MLDVVIFGTGLNGERAWQAANGCDGVNVVCFADNDARKHGSTLHERPVVGAAALPDMKWDVVVLASMYATQIREQLHELDLPDELIIAPEPAAYGETLESLRLEKRERSSLALDEGSRVLPSELPSVLILTYETLNSTHGTGVLLQRYFADFPLEKLFSICHSATGHAWLPHSCVLAADRPRAERVTALREAMDAAGFSPDLVYVTAFNELDLELLAIAQEAVPDSVPVVQHFMDYMPHDAATFDRTFRATSHTITDLWALTDGLARDLERRYSRPVKLVTALHQTPTATWKQQHAAQGAEVQALILGNLWQPWTLPVISRIWGRCRERVPGLRPIDWYVHPARVQSIIDAGYEIGDHVVWRGFYSGQTLRARLQRADLALMPFNITPTAVDFYTRFSLPSRLTELCGAGLPIFALASADTEPARFLAEHRCGVSVSGADEDLAVATLVGLINSRGRRAELGAVARQVAETEFDFGPFYAQLLGMLVRLGQKSVTPEADGARVARAA